jgi:hypothetical protein
VILPLDRNNQNKSKKPGGNPFFNRKGLHNRMGPMKETIKFRNIRKPFGPNRATLSPGLKGAISGDKARFMKASNTTSGSPIKGLASRRMAKVQGT